MQCLARTELRLASQLRISGVAFSIASVAGHPAEIISKGDRLSRTPGSAGQMQDVAAADSVTEHANDLAQI